MVAPAAALALIPDELTAVEAGPLMCAGITTFNALRHSGARPGDLVAILGIGGLGHLGVQFAAKMGFKTVAIARGQDKGPLARQLGAHHYIDSQSQDPAAELAKLGGAQAILATATSSKAMSAVAGGLGVNGKLLIIGATMEPLDISANFTDHATPVDRGLALRDVDRFAGYPRLQRADRSAGHDRGLSAGARRRGL